MKKLKVKSSEVTPKNIKEAKKIQIRKAKSFFQSCPFATPLYIAMKTGLNLDFIVKNKKEIFGHN